MNAALPAGITVQRCYEAVRPVKELCYVNYIVTLEYEAGAPSCPDAAPDFVIFHRRAVLDGQFQTWE